MRFRTVIMIGALGALSITACGGSPETRTVTKTHRVIVAPTACQDPLVTAALDYEHAVNDYNAAQLAAWGAITDSTLSVTEANDVQATWEAVDTADTNLADAVFACAGNLSTES